MINAPHIHVGVISRNFTLNPGRTIRTVLRNSNVEEYDLDFVIPVPVGGKKYDVMEGMKSYRYKQCIIGADEISDYNAAVDTGYNKIIMASYGFDNRNRLISQGEVPPEIIFDTPEELASHLSSLINKQRKLKNRQLVTHNLTPVLN